MTVWFRISNSTHDVEIRNDMKSANIELCVICRFSLEKRLEIGRTLNFFRSSAPKKFGTVIILKFRFKKVRFSDAVAAFGANFPRLGGDRF